MINVIRNLSLLFMVFALPAQVFAGENSAPVAEKDNYRECLNMAANNPKGAFDEATRWESLGGGHAARYCALAALMGMGRYGEAAQGFERLADALNSSVEFKAKILARGAEAWLLFGDNQNALQAIDTAIRMNTEDAELFVVRAQVFAAMGAFWEATDDLGRAISIAPHDADALAFRASAWRQLDVMDLAEEDAKRALGIVPTHPAALLELGNILRIQGDNAGARQKWLAIISAWPTSEAARAAQTNIELLDVAKQ
ncbi:MAG: hypothetical protein OEW37_10680 [Rhodospirillaceae bacterium]|nr:hypothetical protein [Rhodospirillaceae bacterium]